MNKCFRLLATGSLVALGVFGICSTVSALEYRRYQRVEFTFNPSINISLSSGDLVIPKLMPGSAEDSNVIGVNVSTNVAAGLRLSATVGRNSVSNDPYNNTDLVDIINNNNNSKFSSIASNVEDVMSFGANEWGYSYCIVDSATCSSDDPQTAKTSWISGNVGNASYGYNGLPRYDATGVVLTNTNTVTDTAVMFKIGAKAGNNQVAGTYTNVINFVTTANVITTTYTLSYSDPSGEGINIPAGISTPVEISEDTVIQLSSTEPTRGSFSFDGWCTVVPTNNVCVGGQVYEAGGNYNISNVGGELNINLYALWDAPSSITELTYMQDFAKLDATAKTNVLSSMISGAQYRLEDSRDRKVYYVSKLADGRVWMTQNLDHDIVTTADFYTHENTDLGYGETVDTNAKWTAPDGVSIWSGIYKYPRYYDPDDYSWHAPNDSELEPCNQNNCHNHLGNYYNWTAAIAMEDSNNITGGNVNQSICPAGWTLPRGGTDLNNNDFAILLSKPEYGWSSNTHGLSNDKTMWGDPLYFALSGTWYGSLDDVGSGGYYWSSTVDSINNAYILNFGSYGNVYLDSDSNRSNGFSVRCVLR